MASRGSRSRGSEIPDAAAADRGRRIRDQQRALRRRALAWHVRRILRLVGRLALVALLVAAAGAAAVVFLFVRYSSDPNLPTLSGIADYRPKTLIKVVDREGKLIGELGAERRTLIPYAQIPKVLVEAVIAAEDADFFKHKGIDYSAVVRAALANLISARYAQGFSTITQQVVKQLLLTPDKTLRRKVQEVILARRLTEKLSKEEILEIYLNHMYFGHGRYGCEEAAQFYFAKPVGKIDAAEAALLAALLQSPERLSPRKHREAAKTRQRYVLGQMAHYGYIHRATARALAARPIVLAPEPPARINVAPEAVDAVYRRLVDIYGAERVATLGATVKTTIDLRLQEAARQVVERGLEELDGRQGYSGPSQHLSGKTLKAHRARLAAEHGKAKGIPEGKIIDAIVERLERNRDNPAAGRLILDLGGELAAVDLAAETRYATGRKPLADRFTPGDIVRVRLAPERRRGGTKERPVALELGPQAAMVVMDPTTREVLALVGGYGFRPGGFDRSLRAHRQSGSAFKPFVYATAIESRRYTAASLINDSPEVYSAWKPQNYEKEAFRGAVRLRVALKDSINTVPIKLLADLGLPLVRDIAQRTGITSPLPDSLGLSAALGTGLVTPIELANAYATFAAGGMRAAPRFVTAVGEEIMTPPSPEPALSAETAYILVSLMRSVADEGTGRAAGLRLRRPIAGKTGTSSDNKDAWFIGFSPDLLAAVWVGFDDGHKLGRGEVAGRAALPLWIELMARALATRRVRDFPQPPAIVVTRIDPASGLLAGPGSEGIAEVFLQGTTPHETAPAPGQEASADKLLLEGPGGRAVP